MATSGHIRLIDGYVVFLDDNNVNAHIVTLQFVGPLEAYISPEGGVYLQADNTKVGEVSESFPRQLSELEFKAYRMAPDSLWGPYYKAVHGKCEDAPCCGCCSSTHEYQAVVDGRLEDEEREYYRWLNG